VSLPLAQVAGELSILGLGRPTELLGLSFNSPLEQLEWDNAILTQALGRVKAAAEGKNESTAVKLKKMKKLREEKRANRG